MKLLYKIFKFLPCKCINAHQTLNFGEFIKKIDCEYCILNRKHIGLSRCNKCCRYHLFCFDISLDWEADTFDLMLYKYKISRKPLNDFINDFNKRIKDSTKYDEWFINLNKRLY